MPRACVYYVRGGFHPENCTGCFSGPDRVNSSSCALPAGEACIYVCAQSKSVCVCTVGVELMEKVVLDSVSGNYIPSSIHTKKKGYVWPSEDGEGRPLHQASGRTWNKNMKAEE